MTEHRLPDLPPDVSALLQEARGFPQAPADERREVAARLRRSVGLALPGSSLPLPGTASRLWITKALGVAVVIASAAGVTRLATRHDPPRSVAPAARANAATGHELVVVERPSAAPAPPSNAALAPAGSPAGAPPRATEPAVRRAHALVAPAIDDDRSFRDELSLLERAHAALSRDDAEGALSVLSQHARRFPQGRLEPEREAIRVQCAAARGDRAGAEAARRRFHRRFPDSVLGPSVDRSVDGAQ